MKIFKRTLIFTILVMFPCTSLSWGAPAINELQAIIQQGSALIGLKAPTWVDAEVVSTANVGHTVPAGAKYVLFSATNNFYACFTGTAVIPTGAVTDGSAPELNPVLREIRGIATINLIAPTSCVVTLIFYR